MRLRRAGPIGQLAPMRTTPLALPEVLVIEPDVHRDPRGFFLETYRSDRYHDLGIRMPFVQDNYSRSVRGTVRGLHAQRRTPQGKLIRVVAGAIFDVAVDIRPDSPTRGRWVGAELSAENFLQCWVPPGFAHGFCALSEVADVEYKCTTVFDGADEIGVVWDDPDVGITWPVTSPLLSAKDRMLPRLRDLVG
jgi:dTDP-4-dehydrorhamnose 3,5-epimerase